MRKHTGMRPQDVALLLKLTLPGSGIVQGKELAQALHLSQAEVSESLRRCLFSRLLQGGTSLRQVQPSALLEFLLCGLPYVFPVQPGALVRGLATGPSAPPLVATFGLEPAYVWPGATGNVWGEPPWSPYMPIAFIPPCNSYRLPCQSKNPGVLGGRLMVICHRLLCCT